MNTPPNLNKLMRLANWVGVFYVLIQVLNKRSYERKFELSIFNGIKIFVRHELQPPFLAARCRQDLDMLTKVKILLKPTVVPAE